MKFYWSWRSYPELRGLSREEQLEILRLATQEMRVTPKYCLRILLLFAVIAVLFLIAIFAPIPPFATVSCIVIAFAFAGSFYPLFIEALVRKSIRDVVAEAEEEENQQQSEHVKPE